MDGMQDRLLSSERWENSTDSSWPIMRYAGLVGYRDACDGAHHACDSVDVRFQHAAQGLHVRGFYHHNDIVGPCHHIHGLDRANLFHSTSCCAGFASSGFYQNEYLDCYGPSLPILLGFWLIVAPGVGHVNVSRSH